MANGWGRPGEWGRRVIAGVIRGYQMTVSPWLGPSCRFHPTCSEYGRRAVVSHGVLRGLWLTMRRVARCHPFHPGGHDPVPPALGSPHANPEEVHGR